MPDYDMSTPTRFYVVAVLALVGIGFSLGYCTAAHAQRPIPADQWTGEARTWLARGFVAEAGWENETDHVGIAYVLARRWARAVERWPTMSFLRMVRNYCAALGYQPPRRRGFWTPRQKWVRALRPDFLKPDHWPKHARHGAKHPPWGEFREAWRAAMRRAEDWALGRLEDPCHGLAWHWGGVGDPTVGPRVHCGETVNTFFALKRRGSR